MALFLYILEMRKEYKFYKERAFSVILLLPADWSSSQSNR